MPRKRTFFIVPHTHWDREWYQPFQTFRARLVEVVDRLLDVLDADDRFAHFLLDGHTAAAFDYLEVRPEAAERLARHVRSGRIAVGPFHILMDEFLVSGETHIRNLATGIQKAHQLGRCLKAAYLPDMFGHIGQFPQILARAGIYDAFVWRGVPAKIDKTTFRWVAPDGTSVRAAYMATSYSNGTYLPTSPEALRERLNQIATELERFSPEGLYLVMNGTDHAPCQPELPAALEKVTASMNDGTEVRISSLEDYLAALPSEPTLEWKGELRSGARVNLLMGVVSNRVDLRRETARVEERLARYAEPLVALYAPDVPRRYLDLAWDRLVQNSAHDSICACSVDKVTDQVWTRLTEAGDIVEYVFERAMEKLARRAITEAQRLAPVDRVDTPDSSSTGDRPRGSGLRSGNGLLPGVILFNPSVAPRKEIAEVEVPLPDSSIAIEAKGAGREGAVELETQIVGVSEPEILLRQTLPSQVVRSYVMAIASREVMGYFINEVFVDPDSDPPSIDIVVEDVPIGELDVDEAKARILEFLDSLEEDPQRTSTVKITARRQASARLLLETPEIPPLGWGAVVLQTKVAAEREPISASPSVGSSLESAPHRQPSESEPSKISASNDILDLVVHPNGAYTLRLRNAGLSFEGLGKLVDGGEWGDTYNYSPPYQDLIVDRPEECDIEYLYQGPLATGIAITRRYSIPKEADPSTKGRSKDFCDLVVRDVLELRRSEPFLRVTTTFTNSAKDHRLRAHFPLPFEPEGSFGGSPFEVAERGLVAEGGPHEYPLPTYPGRGLLGVWGKLPAGSEKSGGSSEIAGLAILVEAVAEYEVVGSELAFTLLRATGMLSRPDSKLRPAGAGPSIPTSNSQCLGSHTWSYAVMPFLGSWADADVVGWSERFVHPLVAEETDSIDHPAVSGALQIEASGCLLSSLQPADDGCLLRVWAPGKSGRLTVDCPAEETTITGTDTPDHSPLAHLRSYAAGEPIELAGWEIKTLKIRPLDRSVR
jgi:mannosylglycerate hydrolase